MGFTPLVKKSIWKALEKNIAVSRANRLITDTKLTLSSSIAELQQYWSGIQKEENISRRIIIEVTHKLGCKLKIQLQKTRKWEYPVLSISNKSKKTAI